LVYRKIIVVIVLDENIITKTGILPTICKWRISSNRRFSVEKLLACKVVWYTILSSSIRNDWIIILKFGILIDRHVQHLSQRLTARIANYAFFLTKFLISSLHLMWAPLIGTCQNRIQRFQTLLNKMTRVTL
jgi:hypothetical protein